MPFSEVCQSADLASVERDRVLGINDEKPKADSGQDFLYAYAISHSSSNADDYQDEEDASDESRYDREALRRGDSSTFHSCEHDDNKTIYTATVVYCSESQDIEILDIQDDAKEAEELILQEFSMNCRKSWDDDDGELSVLSGEFNEIDEEANDPSISLLEKYGGLAEAVSEEIIFNEMRSGSCSTNGGVEVQRQSFDIQKVVYSKQFHEDDQSVPSTSATEPLSPVLSPVSNQDHLPASTSNRSMSSHETDLSLGSTPLNTPIIIPDLSESFSDHGTVMGTNLSFCPAGLHRNTSNATATIPEEIPEELENDMFNKAEDSTSVLDSKGNLPIASTMDQTPRSFMKRQLSSRTLASIVGSGASAEARVFLETFGPILSFSSSILKKEWALADLNGEGFLSLEKAENWIHGRLCAENSTGRLLFKHFLPVYSLAFESARRVGSKYDDAIAPTQFPLLMAYTIVYALAYDAFQALECTTGQVTHQIWHKKFNKVRDHGFAVLSYSDDPDDVIADQLYAEIDEDDKGTFQIQQWCNYLGRKEVAARTPMGRLIRNAAQQVTEPLDIESVRATSKWALGSSNDEHDDAPNDCSNFQQSVNQDTVESTTCGGPPNRDLDESKIENEEEEEGFLGCSWDAGESIACTNSDLTGGTSASGTRTFEATIAETIEDDIAESLATESSESLHEVVSDTTINFTDLEQLASFCSEDDIDAFQQYLENMKSSETFDSRDHEGLVLPEDWRRYTSNIEHLKQTTRQPEFLSVAKKAEDKTMTHAHSSEMTEYIQQKVNPDGERHDQCCVS